MGVSLHDRLYDFGCRLRDNGVTRSPEYAHSIGYPMSQREKRGFSWDGAILSVSAVDDFGIFPEAYLAMFGNSFFPTPAEPLWSLAKGVGQAD